ncbi:hypothetical protein GMMP15_1700063 [Candidatus Magnetomoraceae bacterium gMMP-15]
MIKTKFEEAHSPEWVNQNITDPTDDLIILRKIIPWNKIIKELGEFYDSQKGRFGKSLRIIVALLILLRFEKYSDVKLIKNVKQNRYIQYFSNVPDEGLNTFLHPSTLCCIR